MAQSYLIRWTKKDEEKLKHVVKLFNNKVKRLSKNKSKRNYLPDIVNYEDLKEGIKSRAELNRKINSLSRFMKKGASDIKYVNDEGITAWELREARIEKSTAKRRYQKELNTLKQKDKKSKYYKKYSRASMGSKRVRELESIIKNLPKLEKLSGEEFRNAISRLHNIGTSDFNLRRDLIFQENYFSMLEKSFGNLESYKKLMKKLKTIAPQSLYKFLTNISDKYNDIKYMYEQKYNEQFFNEYVKDVFLELQAEEELDELDIDFEEGE